MQPYQMRVDSSAIATIPSRPMQQKRIPFLVRLHPDSRELLTKATADQRRSISSIIDQCVRDQLQPRYGGLEPRLQRFLMGVKQ